MAERDGRPASNGRSPVFFIVGPTAVGKTDLAVEVASRCNGEIVGADAFQIYRGMDILTGIPTLEQRRLVPHHLIGFIPVEQKFDVAEYQRAATAAIEAIHKRGKIAFVTGGSGLYVRALTNGLDALPSADPKLRVELEQHTLAELQQKLRSLDPGGADRIDLKNRRRLIRAIEVYQLSGHSMFQQRKRWQASVSYSGVLLTRQREALYARINRRVENMFAAGLLEEVARLPALGPTARHAIGLSEAHACLRSEISQREAIEKIQQATRRYAKRQLTWFRRDPILKFVDLTAQSDLDLLIQELVRNSLSAADLLTDD